MNNNTELTRMEEALRSDEELRQKLEEACKKIAESGEAKNDGEIMVKAAAELGYSITIEELERASASAEELSEEELNSVSGGEWALAWEGEDEYGHDRYCVSVWHCNTITLHTNSKDKAVSCFADYFCGFVYKKS